MSKNRDIAGDQLRTREVLAGGPRLSTTDPCRNWLGHELGSDAAEMDNMLADGTSVVSLLRVRATPEASENHLKHLAMDHGLTIAMRADGRFAFA